MAICKGFVPGLILTLIACLPLTGNSQQIVWQRQVHGYLDGVQLAFYMGGADYTKPVLADIDNDGDGDLFVGEHDGYLNVFENLGGYPPNWFCQTTALDTIDVWKHCAPHFWDIDVDGDLDMFLGCEDGTIWFYQNDGTPQVPDWIFQTNYWDSIDVTYHSIPFFRDLDADNDADLLIANNSGGAAYFKNIGTPTNPIFRFEASYYQGFDMGMKSSVCVYDLNADNLQDVIMSGLEGGIFFFRNRGPAGNPSFANRSLIASVPHNGMPNFWDLDDDGDLDLVSGEADGNVNYFTNSGTPSLPQFQLTTTNLAYFDEGMDTKPALADLDADGDLDMVVGRFGDGMTYVKNVGAADSAAWQLLSENFANYNPAGIESPTFCDLDADGDQDLVVGLEDGTLTRILNTGSPTNAVWGTPTSNYGGIDVGTKAAPVFADIDGDNDFDLFIGSQTGTVRYLRNNGNPANPIWQDLGNLPNMDVGSNSLPTFADIEGDGDLDLIIGNGNLQGWLDYYRNDGSAYLYSWAPASTHYGIWDFGDNSAPCFADINDDEHPDLLIGCNAGGIWRYDNLGLLHDVAITMTPVSPPIQIPAHGGEFQFTIAVAAGDSNFTGDVWVDVTMPDGSIFGPTVGPVTITVMAGTSMSRLRTQGVLGIAPPGMYSENGHAGLYPDSIWSQDSFPFEKLPFGDGPIVDHWYNIGEAFGTEEHSNASLISAPQSVRLEPNHPNPFNSKTIIRFELRAASHMRLSIYDISGHLVQELVNGWRDAGDQEIEFDGSDLASGIYLYRIESAGGSVSGKMVLLK